MLSMDNRAGTVMTPVAVYVTAAAILYLARGSVIIRSVGRQIGASAIVV